MSRNRPFSEGVMSCHDPLTYRFTRRQIARCRCVYCGVNVIEIGDYCMLKPEIWQDKLQLGWNDNACLKCVELKLGRKLKPLDFATLTGPFVEGYPWSDLQYDRRLSGVIFLRSGEMVDRKSPKGKAEIKRQMRRSERLSNKRKDPDEAGKQKPRRVWGLRGFRLSALFPAQGNQNPLNSLARARSQERLEQIK